MMRLLTLTTVETPVGQINFWLASWLQQRLQDGHAGMGDGDPVLTEILQFAALEFGIESDDHANERREESRAEGMRSDNC